VLAIALPAVAFATQVISMSGSTAAFPLIELLTSKYSALQHHKVKFIVAQGGSTVGINDVLAGRVSIAGLSRDPLFTPSEAPLIFYPIAKYAICVITNKANTLASLTQAQLTAIFTGKTRSWSGIPGAGASGSIDLISRTSVAGVLTSFQTALLLEGKKVSSIAAEESSDGLVKQAVENDPNAIGFVSNYQSDKGGVNVLGVNGVACNKTNAAAGTYPGVARFYEVTKGRAAGAAAGFISWIRGTAAARKIISTQWIPY